MSHTPSHRPAPSREAALAPIEPRDVPAGPVAPRDVDTADVALAMAGDTAAFERLFHLHAPRVQLLAVRMVGRDGADDAVQDIFVRAWDRLPQFRGDARFGSWLHRLAVNVLLRHAERARRQVARRAPVEVDELHAAPQPESLDVETALARLAPELRQVVVLHDIEGHAHDEIAGGLGISVSASKMRLHRARLQLREWLLR